MKFINNRECIWNPTTDCLGCPSQPTCEATLKDIATAMWEENQSFKRVLEQTANKLTHDTVTITRILRGAD
jgi:hypothetical protein